MTTVPHRKRVRDAVKARLTEKGGLTDAVDRVFTSRNHRLFKKDLPAILVYVRSEQVADARPGDDDAPSLRTLRLAIEGVAEAGDGVDDVDDRLDVLAEQIEAALHRWSIPGLETARVSLNETEIQVDAEGDAPVGGVRLTYTVACRVARPLIEEGEPPADVRLGIAPRIGAAHEPAYSPITSLEGLAS